MAGVGVAGDGGGGGFATESYAALALYTTLANLSGAFWRIRRARPPRLRLGWTASPVEPARPDVCFAAHNGLMSDIVPCPKSANKRLMHRSKQYLYSINAVEQSKWVSCFHVPAPQAYSNLAAVGANAQGRIAAFPSLRPVLADQCRSQQGCLPTMRVQLRGCSSAQRFRAHSRRYGSCGYRHALQVSARDPPSFACSSFS